MRSALSVLPILVLGVALGCGDGTNPVGPGPQGPDSEPPRDGAELIEALVRSYQDRNIQDFTNLFPTDEEAEYLFLLNEPDPDDGSTNWGRTVELRVHQRMFDPEDTPVGQDPVPMELWLTDVSVNLTLSTSWEERADLYQGNGGQLDPLRWEATDAEYHATLFFATLGETDYTVDGRANFVVINDLTKAVGDNRKFLIYRWEDLGDWSAMAVSQERWALVKCLYR